MTRRSKTKSAKSLPGGCLSLFGLPFLGAGLFMSWLYFSSYSDWWRARSWEEAPCWIESAKLKTSRDSDSTTYQAQATYCYEFEGREYHGDRVTLHKGSDNLGDFHQTAHRELKQYVVRKAKHAEARGDGKDPKPFRCYVNPDQPGESVLYRDIRWQMLAFLAIFALTFPAVGGGLVVGGIVATIFEKKDAELKGIHPEEPWKWKSDWAGSTIPEKSSMSSKAVYIYTIWSGLVILALILATASTGAFQREPTSWLLLIFVALWCFPVWIALRLIRQKLAVGSPRFEPVGIPASPGGRLAGAILLERPLPIHGFPELTLVCEKSTTRATGDGDSTHKEQIWTHTEGVTQDLVTRDLSGYRVPVSFALPLDAPDSGVGSDPSVKHCWRLQLKVPGTAIAPEFEVPVFRVGDSPAMPTMSAPSIEDHAFEDLPAKLASRKILAEFDGERHPVSLFCPAGRNRSLIFFLIFLEVVWAVAAMFILPQHASRIPSLIIWMVWLLSAVLVLCLLIYLFRHERRVRFNDLGLEITDKTGPWIRTVSFEKSRIVRFSHDTNMSSNNTNFYRVRMEDVNGRKKTLVGGITESTTAAVLEARLESWRKSTNWRSSTTCGVAPAKDFGKTLPLCEISRG
jgi:hypothetical protein